MMVKKIEHLHNPYTIYNCLHTHLGCKMMERKKIVISAHFPLDLADKVRAIGLGNASAGLQEAVAAFELDELQTLFLKKLQVRSCMNRKGANDER